MERTEEIQGREQPEEAGEKLHGEAAQRLEFVLGDLQILEQLREQKPLPPFSEESVAFLEQLSMELRQINIKARMPDVAALAFWCRRSHLERERERYMIGGGIAPHGIAVHALDTRRQYALGRGVTLHFVPSNMALMFAYSMAAALLAGNTVLLRLPSKASEQERTVIQALEQAFIKRPEWRTRMVLFRYEHNPAITAELSARCDVRVIWGGDSAVLKLRSFPLKAGALELPFASRRSAAVLRAEAVLEEASLERLAQRFYNDTYQVDQNACSSPHVLYWLGEEAQVERAKERFWAALSAYAASRYETAPVLAVRKWEAALYAAAQQEGSTIANCRNLLVRTAVPRLSEACWEQLSEGGFFLEASGETLEGLLPALTRTCQTLTVFGISQQELAAYLTERGVAGVDRIVSVGQALDFQLVWDGIDLIEAMSRRITYEQE